MRNFVEFYNDFFPATEDQLSFFKDVAKDFAEPAKFLQIGSNTGTLAIELAKQGYDVTGIEMSQQLLDSSTMKKRNQLLFVRFFKLSVSEIKKYLGKGFYNVIFNLDSRITFGNDKEKLQEFFYTAKSLISENGKLVLNIYNYEYFIKNNTNPEKTENCRARFLTKFDFTSKEKAYITQIIEYDENKSFNVIEHYPFYPISRKEIEEMSKKAGFSKVDFYSSIKLDPLKEDSEKMFCIIS